VSWDGRRRAPQGHASRMDALIRCCHFTILERATRHIDTLGLQLAETAENGSRLISARPRRDNRGRKMGWASWPT
jgi:hypothetical protein